MESKEQKVKEIAQLWSKTFMPKTNINIIEYFINNWPDEQIENIHSNYLAWNHKE